MADKHDGGEVKLICICGNTIIARLYRIYYERDQFNVWPEDEKQICSCGREYRIGGSQVACQTK
jgi:hypothetical protein